MGRTENAERDRTGIALPQAWGSGVTAFRLDEKFETIPAGKHKLRGRGQATEVFQLGKVATSRGLDIHRDQAGRGTA
ncbi:hypothetical protein MAXJ12_26033 [Mesorhizobium alhagi CCNWXJ12-2]|uniref:Uncharacterized protein n=1 Tax=Mesorhizobium alhagi CCNWXJ12-2 TaxID=1107882 RepID=H0HYC8_9HYPH|nr:hypothetical protein MAXJ12_26033 [Mesorhizobium alhagi CCNWXJ12-2]